MTISKKNQFKSINKETLNELMQEQIKHNFSLAVENKEETVISLSSVMSMWNIVSEYEKTNTLSQNNENQKDNYKKLLTEIKDIISGEKND